MRRPVLHTSIPGPEARDLIGGGPGAATAGGAVPAIAERAQGCWIVDVDGNDLLDMSAGGGACTTGHGHPSIVAAIREQAGRIWQRGGDALRCSAETALAARLARAGAVRGPEHGAMLCNSGPQALRTAVALAHHRTGRPALIAFTGPAPGRARRAAGLAGAQAAARSRFGSLVADLFPVPFPDPLRRRDEALVAALEDVGGVLGKLAHPEEVAAIVIEPVQGEAGGVVAPAGLLVALRRLCDQHGILLVLDEVEMGPGRSGKMFAWQHAGAEPDILCLGEGLASGLPLGAVIACRESAPSADGPELGGGGASALCCAAGSATLDLLEAGLVERAQRLGDAVQGQLREAVGGHPRVGEVRGRGLAIAIELVKSREGLDPDPALRDQMLAACLARGVLLARCGQSALGLSPALTVEEDEAKVAIEILAEALGEVG
ncbi:MAG: aminotransferase class III-fold pyridoxal phosphate-dependent enzyme [Deltaproteobacteria bacterium]|nr:aminotransferase class III-fold pyridoxal phosphate-dependent enzyme [Deltaproteobacteria bacterium]